MRNKSKGSEIYRETVKNMENEKYPMQDLIMATKVKNVDMREKDCRTWNMARNTQNRGK